MMRQQTIAWCSRVFHAPYLVKGLPPILPEQSRLAGAVRIKDTSGLFTNDVILSGGA